MVRSVILEDSFYCFLYILTILFKQRPTVSVQSIGSEEKISIELPAVFKSPIRTDIVNTVHANLAKNHRQPYAVSNKAGAQTSAQSWGTGRAVSRIPRVAGGGTSRSGQGAFGNMCRGGRMFAPTKVWRRWHRRVNIRQRRFAVCSALAASAVPSLVMARGHRISGVPEIPLILAKADLVGVKKTKQALALLKAIHADEDVEKVKDSRHIRTGHGRHRNRRYVQRRGPLVIFDDESNVPAAFRNIAGVEIANVHRLNLLQLAPGGHVGRLIVWTQDAFQALDKVFGKPGSPSTEKTGFILPRAIVTNADMGRIVNSPEVQSHLRPKKKNVPHPPRRNPLNNIKALVKLNPYAKIQKRNAILTNNKNFARRQELLAARRSGAKDPSVSAKLKTLRKESKTRTKSRSVWYNSVFGN